MATWKINKNTGRAPSTANTTQTINKQLYVNDLFRKKIGWCQLENLATDAKRLVSLTHPWGPYFLKYLMVSECHDGPNLPLRALSLGS